jgi:hypothetical protein
VPALDEVTLDRRRDVAGYWNSATETAHALRYGSYVYFTRNLGLITGASVMGAVFALASATTNITTAHPEAVASGMRITFTVAALLIVVALAIAVGSRALATRPSLPGDVS